MCVKKSLRSGALGRIEIINLAQQAGSKAGNAEDCPVGSLDGAHFILSRSSQEQMRFSTLTSKTPNQKYL